jgi:hypothetical protein
MNNPPYITPIRVSARTNMGLKMVEEDEYKNLTNVFLEKYGLKRRLKN